jgi:hypothetical protein
MPAPKARIDDIQPVDQLGIPVASGLTDLDLRLKQYTIGLAMNLSRLRLWRGGHCVLAEV